MALPLAVAIGINDTIAMDRAELHALVDTLPEGALKSAHRCLQILQSWPGSPPMEGALREQVERMRQKMHGGGTGAFAGRGVLRGAALDGYFGSSKREGDTKVHQAAHFISGIEISVTERLRFTDGGKRLQYVHEVKGPNGEPVRTETLLDL
jgi:hypothetical protein